MRIEPRLRMKPKAAHGGAKGDIRVAAIRRFNEGDRPIEAVSRRRLDVVYMGYGHAQRFLDISLPRVPGYFEELPL